MQKVAGEVTVRRCTASDVKTLVALGIKTFRETFEAVNTEENMTLYLGQTFHDKKLEDEMDEPGSVFFLAEQEMQPVGFAKVRAAQNPAALAGLKAIEIERIYAVKEKIGQGVGKKLMERCLDYAGTAGAEVIWLGVWEHNLAAQRFYLNWGFRKFGEHVFMLGNDAQTDLLMKKELH
jgi:diamine N-acetyltransferase